jgi:hypothetical protein
MQDLVGIGRSTQQVPRPALRCPPIVGHDIIQLGGFFIGHLVSHRSAMPYCVSYKALYTGS